MCAKWNSKVRHLGIHGELMSAYPFEEKACLMI